MTFSCGGSNTFLSCDELNHVRFWSWAVRARSRGMCEVSLLLVLWLYEMTFLSQPCWERSNGRWPAVPFSAPSPWCQGCFNESVTLVPANSVTSSCPVKLSKVRSRASRHHKASDKNPSSVGWRIILAIAGNNHSNSSCRNVQTQRAKQMNHNAKKKNKCFKF